MEALAPKYRWPVVLFSAGTGFIRPGKLRAYEAAGARTYATSDVGTITVRFWERVEVRTHDRSGRRSGETR
jgi:hypothetical protein